MRRLHRVAGVVLVAALSSITLPIMLSAPQAMAASSSVDICPGTGDAPLDVSLVLDKSGSIRTSDQDELRLEAVDAFLRGLLRLAESESGRVVRVSVRLFDTESSSLPGVPEWVTLSDEADVEDLSRAIRDGWNNDAVGGDTDQIAAFSEVFDQVERSQSVSERCSVVVMFTDGVLDTENPGRNTEDLPRVKAEACEDTNLEGEPSLRKRARDLGTNEFILMLDPVSNIPQFEERLNSTVTLFSSITGDTDIPRFGGDIQVTEADLVCPIENTVQTGEILSANDVGDLVSSFLKLSASVRGGESAVRSCPANIQNGTDPLPAGGLISEIEVINFDSGSDPMSIAEFDVVIGESEFPAESALTQIGTSTPEGLVLEVSDPEALPGGWRLQARGDADYCVELFARSDLAVVIGGPDPIPVTAPGQVDDVALEYNAPIGGQVELSVTFGQAEQQVISSSGSTIALSLDPGMRSTGVPIAPSGTLSALGVEDDLFSDIPVVVENAVTVLDFSGEAVPDLACGSNEVAIAVGEVDESGTQLTDTTCVARAGDEVDNLRSFIRAVPEMDMPGRATVTFTASDGTPIGEDWTEFSGSISIQSVVEDLPNQFWEGAGSATLAISYGTAPEALTELESVTLDLSIDIEPRSDRAIALEITALVTILSAMLSLLLLWVFNRLTAQLPKAVDYFYYETDDVTDERSMPRRGVDGNKLQAARNGRGRIQFGPVQIRLVHPPMWKPLSDSIGEIEEPTLAVADPSGSRAGSIPVAFSSLLVGFRAPGSGNIRFVAVVPKRGAGSGIDGVERILADRVRIERVIQRLREVTGNDNESGDGIEDLPVDTPRGPGGGPSTPVRGVSGRGDRGGRKRDEGPEEGPGNGGSAPPKRGPRLPGG